MSRNWKRSAVIPKKTLAVYLGMDISLIGKICMVEANTCATSTEIQVSFEDPDKICYVKVKDLDFDSTKFFTPQLARKQDAAIETS